MNETSSKMLKLGTEAHNEINVLRQLHYAVKGQGLSQLNDLRQ